MDAAQAGAARRSGGTWCGAGPVSRWGAGEELKSRDGAGQQEAAAGGEGSSGEAAGKSCVAGQWP